MSTAVEPTLYEKQQITEIQKWKAEEPGVVSNALGAVTAPLTWLVQKVVPEAAIQGALSASNALAQWMTDTDDICRDGRVSTFSELQTKDLLLSDGLADEVHNWAIALAVAEGTAAGAGGIFTLPADIPALITLALRTIHKIGVCYGYECRGEADQQFVYGILSASGANSVREKVAALATLKAIQVMLVRQTWKAMGEKMVQQQISKEAAVVALRNLAKQLGINITKRKALAAIPVIGAAIGGSVNGWYIREVGWAARRAFQERWLTDNDKLE